MDKEMVKYLQEEDIEEVLAAGNKMKDLKDRLNEINYFEGKNKIEETLWKFYKKALIN